jgi:hypothetical protein
MRFQEIDRLVAGTLSRYTLRWLTQVPYETAACPRCDKSGLVRFETAIQAGKSERDYY